MAEWIHRRVNTVLENWMEKFSQNAVGKESRWRMKAIGGGRSSAHIYLIGVTGESGENGGQIWQRFLLIL